MKNMINFIIVNVLIIIFLIAAIHIKIFFLPLTVFVFLNIYLIYRRSSDLDKNEQKKKIMLHNVKISLGVILGYTDAHNDELITKEELDERINEEIQEIVSMIKDEIYK